MNSLEIDPNKEYILGGDISASMSTPDALCGGQIRYAYMLEKFKQFIKIAEDFDEHGAPTVILFGEKVHVYEHMKLEKIAADLENVTFEGFTNLELLIKKAWDLHKEDKIELAKEKKIHPGTQLLVFTDGAPTARMAVEREIARIISAIDREDEFQISILTVGTIDHGLQSWLDELHDKMEDKSINPRDFDIIHVSKLEGTTFLGAVAANRHEDKVA